MAIVLFFRKAEVADFMKVERGSLLELSRRVDAEDGFSLYETHLVVELDKNNKYIN